MVIIRKLKNECADLEAGKSGYFLSPFVFR